MKLETGSVAIIVLNWNGKDDTLACLESLQQLEYPNYEIVLVDNGSSDDSVVAIREQFPQVILIENSANLGFAAGNNVGIKYALEQGAEFVLLLNNDTIVDSQLLEVFVKANSQYPDAGVFGAKIYYFQEPNRIWYAGAKWLPHRAEFKHVGGGVIDNGKDWEVIRETDYVCGCAAFAKTEVFRSIGFLEPQFFTVWEEIDWCYRARREGYKPILVPGAKVWHKISASFSGGDHQAHYQYYFWRNRLLWIERNIPWQEAISLYNETILSDIYSEICGCLNLKRRPEERQKCKAGVIGIQDYILRRFGEGPKWIYSRI